MTSLKSWLESQITIWQEHAKLEASEGNYKDYGISMAYAKAYHNTLEEMKIRGFVG